MTGTPERPITGAPPVPSVADAAEALSRLDDALGRARQAMAEAVDAAAMVVASGACEQLAGLTPELWLANEHRLGKAAQRDLLVAGRVLEWLPTLERLLANGQVSWGQVVAITSHCRSLAAGQLVRLDQRIADTAERWGGVDGWAPDDFVKQVTVAADEVRDTMPGSDPDRPEPEPVLEPGEGWLAVQPRFDGSSRYWGEADAVGTARMLQTAEAGWQARKRRLQTEADAAAAAAGGRPGIGSGRRRRMSTARRRWAGLSEAFSTFLAGNHPGDSGDDGVSGGGRRARPAVNVLVDLATATKVAGGQVDHLLDGPLPTVSAAVIEALATDADLRAVLTDGARPLAVSAKIRASKVPADVSLAVRARDRGSRFPGSSLSTLRTHEHHLVPQHPNAWRPSRTDLLDGADPPAGHHPDNLIVLGDFEHLRLVHKHGWTPRLDVATGEVWVTRDGVTYRSLPRGTRLEPERSGPGTTPGTRPREPE